MGSSLGFGSNPDNCTPCSDSLSLRLRNCYPLTKLLRLTRRLILQKARSQPDGVGPPTACRFTVSGLFHSPPGVLFTFPSRYWFTIGGQGYLALEGGPPGFPQDFTCPVVLNILPGVQTLSLTGLSPSSVVLSRFVQLRFGFLTPCSRWGLSLHVLQPPSDIGPQSTQSDRFELFPVRSPLLGESLLIYFPQGT